jgi:hypothetical protein
MLWNRFAPAQKARESTMTKMVKRIVLIVATTWSKLFHNVMQLGEVAEIEAQMFGLAIHFNRCTDFQLTTKPAILPNCC